MMRIEAIPALKDNYIWTIINDEHHVAWVVDPGDAAPVIDYLQHHHLRLSGILITHHHWDHTNGLAALLQVFSVPVLSSIHSRLPELTRRLEDAELFIVDHFPEFQAILIPGHTLDHIAYHTQNALFCGDTLFGGGCGRLFEGTAEQLYASLQKLAQLPPHTHIYCGHEYTLDNLRFARVVEPKNQAIVQRIKEVSSIRQKGLPSLPSFLYQEQDTNPFLRCHVPEVIENVQVYAKCALTHPSDVFRELRQWKNGF
ncbi:MAG: hydroxyacylglutathione hydrolase [Legionella sp.]|nr:MAG: hydroxyacylglutathione hydrolase [Legionella sp.]